MAREKGREDGAEYSKESDAAFRFPLFVIYLFPYI